LTEVGPKADGRRYIKKKPRRSSPKISVLDRLEREVRKVVEELERSKDEAERLKTRVLELEENDRNHRDGGSVERLKAENHELRSKLEKVEQKSKEILRKLEIIGEG
jgi:predicted RNase H-like nuclease (RuvC/YqgF family)